MRRLLVIALLAAAGQGAVAQSSVVLRVRAKVGTKNRYAVKWFMDTVGEKGHLDMTTELTETLAAFKKGQQVWKVGSRVTRLNATGVMAEAKAAMMEMDGLAFSSY